jgi:hypothetical protein
MKIQTIILKNKLGHKLELERNITNTSDGAVFGRIKDCSLFGLSFEARRVLQSVGMRCKYNNGTGFSIGKIIDTKNYEEVPNIYKQDTSDINDINVYTVVSIESIDFKDLK